MEKKPPPKSAIDFLALITTPGVRSIIEPRKMRDVNSHDATICAVLRLAAAQVPQIRDAKESLTELSICIALILRGIVSAIEWTPELVQEALADAPPEKAEDAHVMAAMQAFRMLTGRPGWHVFEDESVDARNVCAGIGMKRCPREFTGVMSFFGRQVTVAKDAQQVVVVAPEHVRKMRVRRAKERARGPYDRSKCYCDEMAGFRCKHCPRVEPERMSEFMAQFFAAQDADDSLFR